MSNFLGGLAAAYKGYQQGQDQELERQQLAKDRDQAEKDKLFQQGQREFTQGQQARTLRTQTEDDALNDKLKGIALERDVEVSPAIAGNNPSAAQPAVTRRVARTNDDLYAEQAKNLLAAGKWEKASQLQAASDQLKMKRHAGMFQELDSSWAGRNPKTPEETRSLVEDVKRIFNGDPMAGDIQDYSIGADGMVTMTALNKSTGQSNTRTMEPTQMLDYMRAYYTPESQAKLLADKRAHEYKIAQEKAKQDNEVRVLKRGDRLGSIASGITSNGEPASVTVAREKANAQYGNTNGSVDAVFDGIFKGVERKFDAPADFIAAKDLARRIFQDNGGKVPPAAAVKAALAVNANPALEVPEVNLEDGTISLVYKNARDGDVITRPGYADAGNPKDIKPEVLKSLVASMESRMSAAEFELLRNAAFDKSGKAGRAYLDAKVVQERQKLMASEKYKNQPPDKIEQALQIQLKNVIEPALYRKASLLSMWDNRRGTGLKFDASGKPLAPAQRDRSVGIEDAPAIYTGLEYLNN